MVGLLLTWVLSTWYPAHCRYTTDAYWMETPLLPTFSTGFQTLYHSSLSLLIPFWLPGVSESHQTWALPDTKYMWTWRRNTFQFSLSSGLTDDRCWVNVKCMICIPLGSFSSVSTRALGGTAGKQKWVMWIFSFLFGCIPQLVMNLESLSLSFQSINRGSQELI